MRLLPSICSSRRASDLDIGVITAPCGEGRVRLTDLAARAQMTKQSAGELVSYLEARGYLERVPDPSDGRVRINALTSPASLTPDRTCGTYDR